MNRTTSTSPVSRAAFQAVETLESRLMLAASPVGTPPAMDGQPVSLRNGTLLIAGTARGDSITLVRDALTKTQLEVTFNKTLTKYPLASVKVVRCYGFSGSDLIRIDESAGTVAMPIYVFGGNGNDTIIGGSGADTLVGMVGNDSIVGNAGNDWLEGNTGNDTLLGGDGRDYIEPGLGKDLVNSGAGRDRVLNIDGDIVDTGLALQATPQSIINPVASPMAFNATVVGYTPQQIRKAYEFGDLSDPNFKNRGRGQTIVIIAAYDYPTAMNDLNVFSRQFGLLEVNSKSFVTMYADKRQPAVNAQWANEAAMDLQWAHAIAPEAKLVLMEASSATASDLFNAVQRAVVYLQPAGGVISMSFGVDEALAGQNWERFLQNSQTGKISFVGAAGDTGGAVKHPSVSPEVLAVGGTFLPLDSAGNRTGEEIAWLSGGGGPSTVFARPTYQDQLIVEGVTIGDARVVPDVAYNADNNSGYAVYSTTPNTLGDTGWSAVGGTSIGTPQWAGIAAMINQKRLLNGLPVLGGSTLVQYVYGIARRFDRQVFNDITSGNNTVYNATTGFDRATGWGTPRATALIDKMAIATGKRNPVVAEGQIGFKWYSNFIKPMGTGLPNEATVHFNGNGVANLSLNSANLVFNQFPTTAGDVLDIVATGLQRDGYRIYGRGSATGLMADGTPGAFLLQFEGTLRRGASGADEIAGSFWAISRRGRPIAQGLQSIANGKFGTLLNNT